MFDECRDEGKMGRQLERQVNRSLGEKSRARSRRVGREGLGVADVHRSGCSAAPQHFVFVGTDLENCCAVLPKGTKIQILLCH